MKHTYAEIVSGESTVKILVLSPHEEKLGELRHLLDGLEGNRESVLVKGDVENLASLIVREHPDLVIFERPSFDGEEFAALERSLLKYPGVAVLLLCPTPSAELLLRAMRIGVREVLPSPLSAAALSDVLMRLERRGAVNNRGHAAGKALAFIPCKGGSGATFLAANFAYALATTEKKRVALIDLNLQFGDAALFVSDSVPRNTLADLVRDIGRLDPSFLASSMIQVTPEFGVLAAPEEVDQAAGIKPEHIDRLLDVALRSYDYVILDVGRRLDGTTIRALDRVEAIYPVLQMTLPFLRDAKRLLNAFHSLGYGTEKIHLIANRYIKGGEITLQSVEKTLGHAVELTVPNSFNAVAASVNQGVPIVKMAPHDPVAKCLQELAGGMVHGKQERGWLKSVFSLRLG